MLTRLIVEIILQYIQYQIIVVYLKLTFVVVQTLSCVQLFRNPMDCSPPSSSVHGILQARIREWVAMPSSRGSSQPWGSTAINSAALSLWDKIALGSHFVSAPSQGTKKTFAKTSVPSYRQPPQGTPSYCAHHENSLSGMAVSPACMCTLSHV